MLAFELISSVGPQGVFTCIEGILLPALDVTLLEVILACGLEGSGLSAKDLQNELDASSISPALDLRFRGCWSRSW